MALGDTYASLSELKSQFSIGDSDDDSELLIALSAASSWVTSFCGRDFNKAASATARVFYASPTASVVWVDDISSTTGLIVKTDTSGDGTFDTTWSATDYQLEPLNGVSFGLTGWPYTVIRSVGSRVWPNHARSGVEVTAAWGWPAVPDRVKQATLIMAARLYKRRFSPEGVLGGFDAFGPVRVGTRLDPDVEAMLSIFAVNPIPAA